LDTPITLGDHVVASGPRTLEERIELDKDCVELRKFDLPYSMRLTAALYYDTIRGQLSR